MSEERDHLQPSTLAERSRLRRQRIVGHSSSSFEEAELWDLEFWQSQSPQERLSALVAIHRDVEMVQAARSSAGTGENRAERATETALDLDDVRPRTPSEEE